MKKNILALSLLAAVAAGFTACSDDNLSSESVIKPSKTANTVFDKWLYKNFVVPYNIQIQWRYEDNESDMSYYDVPADSAQSVELAHIVKYLVLKLIPKQQVLISHVASSQSSSASWVSSSMETMVV